MFLRIQPRWRPGGLGLLHHCGCYWGRWCKASWGYALDEKLSNSPVNLWNGTFFVCTYFSTSLVYEFYNLVFQILTNISTSPILQISFLSWTFFATSYSKIALSIFGIGYSWNHVVRAHKMNFQLYISHKMWRMPKQQILNLQYFLTNQISFVGKNIRKF